MSLDMSSGCLRDYQKGLQPGGTPGSVCSKAGPRPRLFFGNVLTEKFSLHPGVGGRENVWLCLATSFSIHSGQMFWCKVASGSLPIFLQDGLLT